jgi:hypothetical protein
MALFQHPHLTRGVIKTPHGSFVISRGFLRVPDELGESLGWRRVEGEPDQAMPIVVRDEPARRSARTERS